MSYVSDASIISCRGEGLPPLRPWSDDLHDPGSSPNRPSLLWYTGFSSRRRELSLMAEATAEPIHRPPTLSFYATSWCLKKFSICYAAYRFGQSHPKGSSHRGARLLMTSGSGRGLQLYPWIIGKQRLIIQRRKTLVKEKIEIFSCGTVCVKYRKITVRLSRWKNRGESPAWILSKGVK